MIIKNMVKTIKTILPEFSASQSPYFLPSDVTTAIPHFF